MGLSDLRHRNFAILKIHNIVDHTYDFTHKILKMVINVAHKFIILWVSILESYISPI
jgi:hypothetical protein